MKAKKNKKTGKWDIQYSYYDLLGVRKQSTKRGFDTKREAEEWVREFLLSQKGNLNMSFDTFVKIYKKDIGKKFVKVLCVQKNI